MTDLRLLTPFSNSGFLQDLINPFPLPAMCTHRPPSRANGLTRALTASKYSPLHCEDVVRSCLRSPRYFLPEHLVFAKKTVPANHHWKRTGETPDTSVQNILKVVHKRTCVLGNPTQRGLQPEDWKGQWPSQQKILKKRKVSRWIMKPKGSELKNRTGHPQGCRGLAYLFWCVSVAGLVSRCAVSLVTLVVGL